MAPAMTAASWDDHELIPYSLVHSSNRRSWSQLTDGLMARMAASKSHNRMARTCREEGGWGMGVGVGRRGRFTRAGLPFEPRLQLCWHTHRGVEL